MARSQKDTVSYFPHDANASDGDTLTVLQSRYGNDGYAFWFKLLEKLSSTDGHYLDYTNPAKWQLFIAKMGVDEITTVEIMNLLVEMKAVDKDLWDSRLIWCQNLVNNLTDVYKNRRRELPQKPFFPVETHIPTDNNAITTGLSTQSKVKESKVKYSIYIVWNKQDIITHTKFTDDIERAINTALKDYSEEDIIRAIENYSEILNDDSYYFKFKWTLKDFLKRGLVKFLDIEIAKSNYRNDKNGTNQRSPRPLPTQYTRPEEI